MEYKIKKLKKNQENRGLDRLSSLPDSILAHILSFLDTRSAIKTSILSKRYKLLWTLSPCLDFSFSEYQTYRFESCDGRAFSIVKKSSLDSFKSYVDRVLQLRERSDLIKFRLSLHNDVGSELIDNCISYAARHKVQHFRLRGLVKENPFPLPKLLLNSMSLISLHLHNATRNSIDLPKSVYLPNLMLLRLKNFEFCDSNFNGEVFLGCPKLETLVLCKCSIRPVNGLKVLDVSCLNLKNLEIRCWRSPWKCFDKHTINVRAPKLFSFLFKGHLARVNFQGGLPFVEEACIDLSFPTACFMVNVSERKRRTLEGFLCMLRQIRNIKFLSLSLKTLEVMAAPPGLQGHAPVFLSNLRLVKFTARNRYMEENNLLPESSKVKKDTRNIALPAHVLHFLLESSPSLKLFGVEIPKES